MYHLYYYFFAGELCKGNYESNSIPVQINDLSEKGWALPVLFSISLPHTTLKIS